MVTEFPLAPDAGPEGIAAAPDGSLWSTQFNAGNIARITTAGLIAEARRIRGSEPFGITVAPDGNPWYAELSANKIPSCNWGSLGRHRRCLAEIAGVQPQNVPELFAGGNSDLLAPELEAGTLSPRCMAAIYAAPLTELWLPCGGFAASGLPAAKPEAVTYVERGHDPEVAPRLVVLDEPFSRLDPVSSFADSPVIGTPTSSSARLAAVPDRFQPR